MISIILYGRNDAHGYNLHRRAALSLNCLAEVLTDVDDEILFVDYNTPDELPTFIEALADTLTDRCLSRLRVLRVPAALHRERFQAQTHLPAVEPVCRNAAARRANPANRWLLSTNTDMILVLPSGESLSDVCRQLAEGFYGLPRFELPEWLWEQLPRSDPGTAISEVRRLGPQLHLDEPSPSHEWVRFDGPGDFQLCLRDDWVAIDGCDENMLLGWHVDSNLSRRLLLRCGSIESLEERLAGYHCNHSRTPTVYHGPEPIGNDITRFFLSVERAELPDQRDTWGLADTTLEEVAVGPRVGVRVARALLAAIPPTTQGRPSRWNPFEPALEFTYDSAHVLPHVADSIVVAGQHVTIGYLGANPVLRDMIERLVRELSHDGPLKALYAADIQELDELAESADLFIVDLGLDAALESELVSDADGVDGEVPGLPKSLTAVAVAFERLVQRERARLERGMHPRRFVLVNSTTLYLDTFVVSNLHCSGTATHSRVRRATVKPVPTANVRVVRDVRWVDRLEGAIEPLELRVGTRAWFDDLEDFRGFGPGWWLPDPSGVWTRGSRAVLAVACGEFPGWARPVLELTADRVGVRRGQPFRIGLVVDGALVDARALTGGTRPARWRVRLPQHALASGVFEVALEVEEPVEWADKNHLGLHVRSLRVDMGLVPIPLRDWFDTADEALARLARRCGSAASHLTSRLAGLRVERRGASSR